MKSLLILPCNPGAKVGNYFLGQLWRRFDKKLREIGLRGEVDFAAIDCIITFLNQDGKGALVHESEMDRVSGFDSHPGKIFGTSNVRKRFERIKILSTDISIGLKRWESSYRYIHVFSNVLAYRSAIKRAITKERLWRKCGLLDFPVIFFGISEKIIDESISCIRYKRNGEWGVSIASCYKKSAITDDKISEKWKKRKVGYQL